ncbi:hypothetical protein [Paenibacillus agaridevorans]|uniref:glycan biosynthesis hexose transferase WsfD n=1 Tax=Paenibacillus agaridevorans TaxID=171404 RepID=UPI001BE40EA4|nr:hypothetical protein [Paenibacillus agaridevorans]
MTVTIKQAAGRTAFIVRYLSPSLLAAILAGVVASAALFVPPYVGMADNGDFSRIVYGNGLYFNAPDYNGQFFGYFVRKYGIFHYFNEYAALFSSQSIFIRLSLALNILLYSAADYDIRFQAVIYVALLMAALYLLVEGLTWRVPRKYGYAFALLAVFLFADTGYTAYFNSFFGESVVLLMALFMTASILLIYRKRYNDYVMLSLFAVSVLLLTTSKQQNAPVGIISAIAGLAFVYLRPKKLYRIAAVGALSVLLLTGVATYALIPQQFVNINQYHAMTRGPMMLSEDPEAMLETFGIDNQFALLAGTNYYERYTTIDVESPMLAERFYKKYGFGSLVAYYATHPTEAIEMLDLAARHAFTIRPAAMGNYEQAAGKPFGEHTRFFTGYSMLKEDLAPKTFGFIVLWICMVTGSNAPSFAAAVKSRNIRDATKLPMLLMLILIGLSGIAVSIIGAGDADLAKHLFLFTVMFDIVTFLAIGDLMLRKYWRQAKDAQASEAVKAVGREPII